MIDFAIIALPRSGTAWASVFLGDCEHDPLAYTSLEELSKRDGGGISCTAMWLYPEFVYTNIKRWVILENDPLMVNKWGMENGFQPLSEEALHIFSNLRGPRIHYSSLFHKETAKDIFEYLRPDMKFDEKRFELLSRLNITSRKCNG